MKQFVQVAPGILRGGAPSPEEVRILKDVWHVKKIVSLDEESGRAITDVCKELQIEHLIIDIDISIYRITPKLNYLKRNIRTIMMSNPVVYIHCFRGMDRTGLAIALYRRAMGWSCEAAMREAKSLGFGTGIPVKLRDLYTSFICSDKISNNFIFQQIYKLAKQFHQLTITVNKME